MKIKVYSSKSNALKSRCSLRIRVLFEIKQSLNKRWKFIKKSWNCIDFEIEDLSGYLKRSFVKWSYWNWEKLIDWFKCNGKILSNGRLFEAVSLKSSLFKSIRYLHFLCLNSNFFFYLNLYIINPIFYIFSYLISTFSLSKFLSFSI